MHAFPGNEPLILDERPTPDGIAILWTLGDGIRMVCAPTKRIAHGHIICACAAAAPEIETDYWLAAVVACGREAAKEYQRIQRESRPPPAAP